LSYHGRKMRKSDSLSGVDTKLTDREILVAAAQQRADKILCFYKLFAEKKPVMLLEMPAEKIYAYPYLDFKNSLNERSQQILEEEYKEALTHNKIVIFVKDTERRKMISFSIDEETI
jgi:hypothetical protein